MMKLSRIISNTPLVIVLLALLAGCNKTIENKIAHKIEKECGSDSDCIISMKSLTDFEWNKLYVFRASARLEDINKALGFNYPHYKEFSRIIVFTNNDKVVYHEENASSVEHLEDKAVVFDHGDSLKYATYTIDQAVFKAKINPIEDGVYYELTPVK